MIHDHVYYSKTFEKLQQNHKKRMEDRKEKEPSEETIPFPCIYNCTQEEKQIVNETDILETYDRLLRASENLSKLLESSLRKQSELVNKIMTFFVEDKRKK